MSLLVDQMRKVSYGLGLVFVSLAISVLIFVPALYILITMQDQLKLQGMDSLGPAGLAINFLALLSAAVAIIGKAYCLQAPEKAMANGPILLSLLFSASGLVISVGSQVPATQDVFADAASLSPLFTILGYASFLIFLRKIAEYVREPFLARRAQWVLSISLIMLPAYVLALLAFLSGGAGVLQAVAALVLLAISIAGILLFVRYAYLLRHLRQAIEFKLADQDVQDEDY